jgi:hypothetical protein
MNGLLYAGCEHYSDMWETYVHSLNFILEFPVPVKTETALSNE